MVVIETSAPDELPAYAPRDPACDPPAGTGSRLRRGGDAEAARALQRASAAAQAVKRASRLRMLESFGLVIEDVPAELVTYLDHAQEWATVEVQRIAREVGGGTASPSVAALVQQAGLALAHSRHATADGRHADSVKYGGEVRANILAAHELAAREARARPKGPAPWTPPRLPTASKDTP